DAVFFHQKVGKQRRGRISSKGFAQALLALQQKVHLRAKRRAGFFLVKIGEEGIVFAVVDAAGVEAFGEDAGQRGFAYAEWTFDGDEARSLRARLGDGCAFGRGVERHLGLSRAGQRRFARRAARRGSITATSAGGRGSLHSA